MLGHDAERADDGNSANLFVQALVDIEINILVTNFRTFVLITSEVSALKHGHTDAIASHNSR